MARVSNQKSSFQHLYDAPLQRRTSPIDDYITSHVCGFLCFVIGCMIQQPTRTSSYSSELSGWNVRCNAESCPSGTFILCCYLFETAIRIRRWWWRGILRWRHTPKMADHEMCVPVSIGFGKTVLIPACIECRAWQMCVSQRKPTATSCGISFAGTWFPSEESATDPGPQWITVPGIAHLNPTEVERMLCPVKTVETLHTGLWKNPGGPSANVYTLESQHQGYHEEPHKSVCSHCYDVLNEDYLIISWYLHVWNGVAVARNPPTCPVEKRSLGENLVNDRWIQCSAQVRLLAEWKGTQFHCLKFRLGSAGEPTICSHCYSVPYMKIPANNQVILTVVRLGLT